MILKKLLGSEQNSCNNCNDVIVHPLCPFCVSLQMKAWLTYHPSLNNRLFPNIREYLNKIKDKFENHGTNCIKCMDKKAAICPGCFTENIFRKLRGMNTKKSILQEYYDFFNYDLDRTKYTDEAEQLGLL